MQVFVNFKITAISKSSLDSTTKIESIFNEIKEKACARSLTNVDCGIPTVYTPKTDKLCYSKDVVQLIWHCKCRWNDLDVFIDAWNAVESEMKVGDLFKGPYFTMRIGEFLP